MTTVKPQRVTLFLNPSIVKQSKAQAVVEELTLTALIERALIKYLPEITILKKPDVKFKSDIASL